MHCYLTYDVLTYHALTSLLRTNLLPTQAHEFFSPLSFEKVYKKEYVPVYKPNIGAQTDTANFDPQVRSNLSVARWYSMNMVVSLPYFQR